MKIKENKKRGFTLAETLITLAIIGVVAALTLPDLIDNHKDKELQAQLKKSYSAISQVFLQITTEVYGGMLSDSDLQDANAAESFFNSLAKYYIGATTTWPSSDEYPNRNVTERVYFMMATYKTYNSSNFCGYFNDSLLNIADGSTIFFDDNGTDDGIWLVALDVNGVARGPNKYGHDMFVFQLTNEGVLVPQGGDDSVYPYKTYCSSTSGSNYNGFGCTEKALSDPDYFKNRPK